MPHPPGGGLVVPYVHPYDSSRDRNPYLNHGRIPGMRPAGPPPAAASPTPIYDSLYAEYRRLFRALPGDRSGEEDLRFEGFGSPYRRTGVTGGRWEGYWEATSRQRRPALPPAPRDARRHGG